MGPFRYFSDRVQFKVISDRVISDSVLFKMLFNVFSDRVFFRVLSVRIFSRVLRDKALLWVKCPQALSKILTPISLVCPFSISLFVPPE